VFPFLPEFIMKDAGMRIRVDIELRSEFTRICKSKDIPAARVLREFMKKFIETEGSLPNGTSSHSPIDNNGVK
jgi:antitoxin component of RelBE/YafQ-DinJ toxin-antitoxin module